MTKAVLPKISIVTPSFNQGEYLEECIDSILSQNYPNLEYIIMDGGSTDNSVEIIRKYEKFLTSWQSRSDGGQYAAIDAGFRLTTGEIMSWLNSDDVFHRGAFQLVAEIFTQREDVRWLTNRPNAFDGSLQHFLPLYSQARYLLKDYDTPFIQQEGTFWRRSLWEEAGAALRSDLQLAGDLELWARFFRSAQLHTVDALLACFRSHVGQKGADRASYFAEAGKVLDDELNLFICAKRAILIPPPPITSLEALPGPSWETGSSGSPPEVSVILTTSGNAEGVQRTIATVLGQTSQSFELIIVNNAENDIGDLIRTAVRGHSAKYLNMPKANRFAAACNAGIRLARGHFLAYAEDDDLFLPMHLETLTRFMEQNNLLVVYSEAVLPEKESVAPPIGGDSDEKRLLRENFIPLPCIMHARSCLDEVGPFDETLGAFADWDLLMRLSRRFSFGHCPTITCSYSLRESIAPLMPKWHGALFPADTIKNRGRLYAMQDTSTL